MLICHICVVYFGLLSYTVDKVSYKRLTRVPLNFYHVIAVDWGLGRMACKMEPFVTQLCIAANALTLCCMAAERYLAIVYPLKFSSFHTRQRALAALAVVWSVAAASASPQVWFYDTDVVCGVAVMTDTGGCLPASSAHVVCKVSEHHMEQKAAFAWLTFVTLFALPVIILMVTYSIIIYKLWVKAPVGVVISDVSTRTRYKRRVIKMLVLVIALFLTCWAPLLIFNLVFSERTGASISHTVMCLKAYLQTLALSCTAYNPVIYALLNHKFRAHFSRLLGKRRCKVAPLGLGMGQMNGKKQFDKNPALMFGTKGSTETLQDNLRTTFTTFRSTKSQSEQVHTRSVHSLTRLQSSPV